RGLVPGRHELYVAGEENEEDVVEVYTSAWRKPDVYVVEVERWGQQVTGIVLEFDYAGYLKGSEPEPEEERVAAKPEEESEVPKPEEPILPRVGRIEGRVLRADTGQPVTYFNMDVEGSVGWYSPQIADPEGRFSLDDGNARSVQLTISAEGFARETILVKGAIPKKPVSNVIVKLQPGVVLNGMVVDSRNNPVAGATIYVGELSGNEGQVRSTVDGSFRLDTLRSEPIRIFAVHASYAVGWVDVDPAYSRQVTATITLVEGGTIEGVVTHGSKPVADKFIAAYVPGGENIGFVSDETDTEGRYRLLHLMPGPIHVYTGGGGPRDLPEIGLSKDVTLENDQVIEINFDLAPGNSVLEGVISINGEVVGGASLWVSIDTPYGDAQVGWVESTTGAYEVHSLPAGEGRVVVEVWPGGGGRTVRHFAVQLEENVRTLRDFDLTGTDVTGRVLGLKPEDKAWILALVGRVAPQASFSAPYREGKEDWVAWTRPAEEGTFRLEVLPPGVYTIRAITAPSSADEDVDDGRLANEVVTVEEGKDLEVELNLE
ncbi:carboxypeptidase-like regulatory domain-containing protein, partial [Candidatus Hydrogenedentota bacterium]